MINTARSNQTATPFLKQKLSKARWVYVGSLKCPCYPNTNPAESLNKAIKRKIRVYERIDEFCLGAFIYCINLQNDIKKGYYCQGKFKLVVQFVDLRRGHCLEKDIPGIRKVPKIQEIVETIREKSGIPSLDDDIIGKNTRNLIAFLPVTHGNDKVVQVDETLWAVVDGKKKHLVEERKPNVFSCSCPATKGCTHCKAVVRRGGKKPHPSDKVELLSQPISRKRSASVPLSFSSIKRPQIEKNHDDDEDDDSDDGDDFKDGFMDDFDDNNSVNDDGASDDELDNGFNDELDVELDNGIDDELDDESEDELDNRFDNGPDNDDDKHDDEFTDGIDDKLDNNFYNGHVSDQELTMQLPNASVEIVYEKSTDKEKNRQDKEEEFNNKTRTFTKLSNEWLQGDFIENNIAVANNPKLTNLIEKLVYSDVKDKNLVGGVDGRVLSRFFEKQYLVQCAGRCERCKKYVEVNHHEFGIQHATQTTDILNLTAKMFKECRCGTQIENQSIRFAAGKPWMVRLTHSELEYMPWHEILNLPFEIHASQIDQKYQFAGIICYIQGSSSQSTGHFTSIIPCTSGFCYYQGWATNYGTLKEVISMAAQQKAAIASIIYVAN
uniref:Transposase n=1 Tax=Panagrolaimus sp. JU765 TaxID=591449 RepID=A0AC34PWS0_9BILA